MLGMQFSPYHQGDQTFCDKLETVGLFGCKPTLLGIHFSPYHQGDKTFYNKLEMVGLWCCKPTYAGNAIFPIPSRRPDILWQTWNGRPLMLQAYSCWTYISLHTIKEKEILQQTWNSRPMTLQAYLCWECNFSHPIKKTRHFATNLKR